MWLPLATPGDESVVRVGPLVVETERKEMSVKMGCIPSSDVLWWP